MRKIFLLCILIWFSFFSCIKAPLEFVDNTPANDPNITFLDNYEVELATYQLDSFVTSSHSVFTIGYHADSLFGKINAGSYVQVDLPADNPVKDKNVSFDSLVIILKPNGSYYGDTLAPFSMKVHRLLQNIKDEDDDGASYYNTAKFEYDPFLLGGKNTSIRPLKDTAIIIRLSDALGRELLNKLKNDDADVETNADFIDYFKGLYLETDSVLCNTLYYFTAAVPNNILRVHYHLNSTFSQEKYIDFPFNVSKQFNSISHSHAGTDLAVFTPFKNQLKKTNLTGHKAYLHSNMAAYIKIGFPTLLSVKELYPYVKVMKAELVITPSPGTYRYPYQLPPVLNVYTTDENNRLNSLLPDFTGQNAQTGNLFTDELYGDKTKYTFDVTGYISNLISEGRFSKSALMLVPSSGVSDAQLQRLVINDQSLNKGIQLKLYVLGL
jgi:hypothetical protein